MSLTSFAILYFDFSNILINAQKYSSINKKYQDGVQDVCCNINSEKLVFIARNGRELLCNKSYGEPTSVLETISKTMRDNEKEYYNTNYLKSNSRETDPIHEILADSIEDLIELKAKAGDNRTVLLLSGDGHIVPVVQKSLKHDWKVEIWSFEFGLSNKLKEEENKNTNVTIKYIDDYFSEITFYHYEWVYDIPKERSLVISFINSILDDEKIQRLNNAVQVCSNLCGLPFMGKYLGNSNMLAIISCIKEKNTYDFISKIWDCKKEIEIEIKDCIIQAYLKYLQNLDEIKDDLSKVGDNENGKDLAEGHEKIITVKRDSNSVEKFLHESRNKRHKLENGNKIDNKMNDDYLGEQVFDLAAIESDLPDDTSEKSGATGSELECPRGFWCQRGLQCGYTHSEKEKELFRKYTGIQIKLYKTKRCPYMENCENIQNSYLCQFSHNDSEVRCLLCKTIGDHWTHNCEFND